MWDFSISKALGLMARTAPFILLRVLVYFGISAALVVIIGTGAGVGYSFGASDDSGAYTQSAFWGGAAGLALAVGVAFFFRDHLMYLVKTPHIAVMVELLEGRPIPGGQGQIAFGRAVVADRFGQASALSALDRLIRGVIAVVTEVVDGAASLTPLPGMAGVMRVYLRLAVGQVDEVILGHAIRTRSENAWEAAHDGLVLYAQNARAILVAAAWLTLVNWLLAALVFLALLTPAGAVLSLWPGGGGGGVVPVVALVFAWAAKSALFNPFALACLLQVFLAESAGQEPTAEWRGRLTQASDRFRKLGERATAGGGVPRPTSEAD